MLVLALVLLVVGEIWHPKRAPVRDTELDSIVVAVLGTNLVPNMGQFLPAWVNAAFLGTKSVPPMRHCYWTMTPLTPLLPI
jgi:hypothetical protein